VGGGLGGGGDWIVPCTKVVGLVGGEGEGIRVMCCGGEEGLWWTEQTRGGGGS
jgi:hypothetical protein